MAVKVIPINNRLHPVDEKSDCIVLRMFDKDSAYMDIAFPFHEDTPNFKLTIPEAMALKNTIDQLIDIKLMISPQKACFLKLNKDFSEVLLQLMEFARRYSFKQAC